MTLRSVIPKHLTEAQHEALATFLLPPTKDMRAWRVQDRYEAYEISRDPDERGIRISGPTFRALIKGKWVVAATPVRGVECWRLSEKGRDALNKPPRPGNR